MSMLGAVRGVIVRRALLNYRIDPAMLQRVLPAPFRPKLHRGFGIGGICMIRFRALRPWFLPGWLGMASENAAHRIAVEWHADGTTHEGVFVPRRDTNAWFQKALGGRLFPGIYECSRFDVREAAGTIDLRILRHDGGEELAFAGASASRLPTDSAFESMAAVSDFFQRGALGYSATRQAGRYHGIELECRTWHMEPLAVQHARSSFFDDRQRFPPGSVQLDCALVMREIDHIWHSRTELVAGVC